MVHTTSTSYTHVMFNVHTRGTAFPWSHLSDEKHARSLWARSQPGASLPPQLVEATAEIKVAHSAALLLQ